MKKWRSIGLIVLACVMLLCGCAGGGSVGSTDYKFEKTMADGYPVQSEETLEWWCPIFTHVSSKYGNLGDTPFAEELKRVTGVNVKFIHPPQEQETTQFNIVLASGDLPDIMSFNWSNYANGGMAGAVIDNIAIPLNSILENGGAPNLKAVLDSDPVWKKSLITDEGWIAGFPGASSGTSTVYSGMMIRKDYLDKVGLAVPETVEEIETALRAFKDQLNVPIPIHVDLANWANTNNNIVGGFGVGSAFYVDNGKVKYGPMEEKYYDFVETMKRWYDDGLLNKEFAAMEFDQYTAGVINGDIAVASGGNGSSWGKWLPGIAEKNPDAEFVSLPYPAIKKGEKPEFGHLENAFQGAMAVITTGCTNVELAARLLDYGYTPEGQLFFQYGKEGRDWVMGSDGLPKLTELITNPEKNGNQSISQALGQSAASGFVGAPSIGHDAYMNEFYNIEAQKQNILTWKDTNMVNHIIPQLQYSVEEGQELAQIKTSAETYKQEMLFKMIAGTEPLTKFPEFQSTLKNIGIDRALEIMQEAYDRYMARD